MFMKTYDQAVEILDKDDQKAVMSHVKSSWKSIMEECQSKTLAEPFSVLGHGDCWNNNMMYQDNKVSDVCLKLVFFRNIFLFV